MSFSRVRLLLLIVVFAFSGVCSATQIPFEYRDGLIWVKVKAAGRSEPLNFLLDSGAGSSVLDLGMARKLGVDFSGSVKVQRVGEGVAATRLAGFSAQVSGIALQSNPLAIDLSETSALCSRRIDGLIGHDFFRDRVVQIDYPARRIRVLDSASEQGCCAVVSMRVRDFALCIPVSLNGSRPRWTRLDTGCDGALHWVDGEGGDDVRATIALGGETIPHVPTERHRTAIFPSEAGLLGNSILSNYRVTIDAVKGRLLLQKL